MIVTISKGQQITIPATMRDELGLQPGSKVDVEQKEGKITIKPIGEDLVELFKKAKTIKPKHHLTAAQMDALNEGMFK